MSNDTAAGNATSDIIETIWGPLNFTAYAIYWEYNPDYPKPYWHRNLGLGLMNTCYSLSILFVIAKVVARFRKGGNNISFLRMDDWVMMLAMIFLVFPLWTCQLIRYHYNYGFYRQNMTDDDIAIPYPWVAGKSAYFVISSLIKIAVSLSFIHILPSSMQKLRIAVWVLIGASSVIGIVYGVMSVLFCTPIAANFNPYIQTDKCFSDEKFRFTWIALNTIIDVCMLIVPILLLKKTFLKPYEKKGLTIVFAANLIGSVALLISIYGAQKTLEGSSPWNDVLYHRMEYDCYNYVEILCYTIGACFPLFSTILVRYLKEQSSSAQSAQSTWTWRKFVPGNKEEPGLPVTNDQVKSDSKSNIVASAVPVSNDTDSLDEEKR